MLIPVFLALMLTRMLPAVSASAPQGPWDAFNFAPASKTVYSAAIRRVEGEVSASSALVDNQGAATLSGAGAWVTLDYGKEVGGLISMNFNNVSSSSSLALSFTESPMFISPVKSDDSTTPALNQSYDGVLAVPAPISQGFWTQPSASLRGGFRFLTIVLTSNDSVTLSNVSCTISFMPHVEDLRDYAGYFYATDPVFHDADFLTKVWYAGAYTVQTNTVALHTGRQVPSVRSPGWANNATLGVAGPIIVDGAKRDRAVWPGDMGIAVPTQFVSTNDLIPTRNALATMFAAQNPSTGALPESGPPLSQQGSDTYHAWSLIGVHNYFLYSGDIEWLQGLWTNYTKAVAFLEGKVDSSGLVNITGLRDWARLGGGGHNAEGNALYYKVITNSAELATYLNETDQEAAWARNSSVFKTTYNTAFWLEEKGMYRDNASTTLCPQDANSLAVLYNLTTSQAQADSVSAGLVEFWNDIGSVAPELPDNISPFIGGLELQAHFQSGNDARAMDLLQREWGYMLYTNLSVQSTLLEGYTGNGSLLYRSYQGYSYDASYTSHAHGWSSGPTSALTFYVLGLTITSPQGRTWAVSPHLSGLPAAEGGFTTPLGWYGVKWTKNETVFEMEVSAPDGTEGIVRVPVGCETTVDGTSVDVGDEAAISLGGGEHVVVVQMDGASS